MTTKIRAKFPFLSLFLLLFIILNTSARGEDLTPEQTGIVESTLLINYEGKAEPPCAADRIGGRWPYGALLLFKGDKLVSQASVSHLGDGRLLVANHSAKGIGGWDAEGGKVVALFYNSEGKMQHAVVKSVETQDPKSDRAVLRTAPEGVKNWHSVSPVFPNPEAPVYNEKTTRDVRWFGADPISTRTIMLGSKAAQMEFFLGSSRLKSGNLGFFEGNSGGIVISKDGNFVEGLFIRGTVDGKVGEALPLAGTAECTDFWPKAQ